MFHLHVNRDNASPAWIVIIRYLRESQWQSVSCKILICAHFHIYILVIFQHDTEHIAAAGIELLTDIAQTDQIHIDPERLRRNGNVGKKAAEINALLSVTPHAVKLMLFRVYVNLLPCNDETPRLRAS